MINNAYPWETRESSETALKEFSEDVKKEGDGLIALFKNFMSGADIAGRSVLKRIIDENSFEDLLKYEMYLNGKLGEKCEKFIEYGDNPNRDEEKIHLYYDNAYSLGGLLYLLDNFYECLYGKALKFQKAYNIDGNFAEQFLEKREALLNRNIFEKS